MMSFLLNINQQGIKTIINKFDITNQEAKLKKTNGGTRLSRIELVGTRSRDHFLVLTTR